MTSPAQRGWRREEAILPDLMTLEGQEQHYAAVRARLMSLREPPPRQTRTRKPYRPYRLGERPSDRREPKPPPATAEDWFLPPAAPYDDAPGIIEPELSEEPQAERPELSFTPRWKTIVREVCEAHGFTIQEMLGKQRHKALVKARHEAFYRLSVETPFSLPQIGARMCKDHTTVLHGIRKHKKRMEEQ